MPDGADPADDAGRLDWGLAWLDGLEALLSSQEAALRLLAGDWRMPPHLRAVAMQTHEQLDLWSRVQRSLWLDGLAVYSGYRASDPRNRWYGAGTEMVSSLQQAAVRLLEAQAAWARRWNEDAPQPVQKPPRDDYATPDRTTGRHGQPRSRARRRTDRRA